MNRSERTLSPFVGRERELADLHELLGEVENGQGQVVGIVAEAGGGKSRLLYEFRQRLDGQQVTYLEGRCLSYGRSIPYHPIVDIVHNNSGITESDSAEVMADKLRFALNEVSMDGETLAPYLLQLLGVKEGTEAIALLTPEAIRRRIFDTLKEMSLNGAQRRPLIFEIEDLHWCDRTSEDYLAFLVESLPGAAILLLTTYRLGYRPSWLEKSYATQISLDSLASQDALRVVHSTRQHAAFPEHLQQAIVEKAEGNPFFLEELTRAVAEQSDLQSDTPVPDTIQGVLSARIDCLPEAHKHLLQTASVLGREFSPRLLQAIWDGTEPVEALLAELKHLEFLYERTGVLEPVYVFKHALTQQVGYESLLTLHRQRIHGAAGRVLETWYADRLDDAYDRLAHHYANTDDAAKAVEYLSLMAEKAAQGYAHAEAVSTLDEALVHAKRLPPEGRNRRMVELGLCLAHSFYFLGRFAETLDLLRQHRSHLEQVNKPALSGSYYFWLSHTYSYLGEHDQAVENAQYAINEAQRGGDRTTMGKAFYVLARVGFLSSSYRQGIEHGQQAVALLTESEEAWWLGQSHWIVGINAIFLGDFAAVLQAEAHAKTIGDSIGDPRLQCYAAWATGWANATRGEWEAGISDCERGLDSAPDPLSTGVAMGFLGCAYLEAGDTARAISMLEPAIEHMDQFQVRFLQGWYTTWLGEAYLLQDWLDLARDRAQHGLDITRDIKNGWGMGYAQRTLGRIAKASGALIEAGTYFHEALGTFSSIHSGFELARIHLDLASLAFSQGHQDAATEHLSTACAWFSHLKVPKYIERTEQIAQEYGVMLTEVSLDALGE